MVLFFVSVTMSFLGSSAETTTQQTPSNPYSEILSKRLKQSKKKLSKYEKYENDSNLNSDQLLALSTKPELLNSIKELEETLKQFSVIQKNEENLKNIFIEQNTSKVTEKVEKRLSIKITAEKEKRNLLSKVLFAVNNLLPQYKKQLEVTLKLKAVFLNIQK